MTTLLPAPVPLDPPPGDPAVLADLAARLDRAGQLAGELGERVSADVSATPGWRGLDADAAAARAQRVGALARAAADGLLRAGGRLARHADLLDDAHGRLARLRAAQEDDFGAAAARMGGILDPATEASARGGALGALEAAEAARRRVAAAIRADVEADAVTTAAVLADCHAAAEGGPARDPAGLGRSLAAVLPGWHDAQLTRRGQDFAAALRDGDALAGEAAARELLPWAHDGVVAAAVLTGLGAEGLRDVLRRLGDGSLSERSALARVVSGVLGAPVPHADAEAVAHVREGRHVDPDDHHRLDSDLVALGMGVVLAAGRGNPSAGPPVTTVREWGRQILARERATGGERIVDRVRLGPVDARAGDPLQEVLDRLAEAHDPAPAAALLRAQSTWSHLLERPWDDDGAALTALAQRAGSEPDGGAIALGSALRALAAGLADDGDPSGWTVDRDTAAAVAPVLARALADRPDVVVEALARAAAGEGTQDRALLRGLGYLTIEPAAAAALDRGMAQALTGPAGAGSAALAAGYAAVREYGQRLDHALHEFAAEEQAGRRRVAGELLMAVAGRPVAPVAALAVVHWDLDGTWDAARDDGERFGWDTADGPPAGSAYRHVAQLLGAPTAPTSPPTDLVGLVVDLLPGGGRLRDVLERGGETVADFLDDERERAAAEPVHPID